MRTWAMARSFFADSSATASASFAERSSAPPVLLSLPLSLDPQVHFESGGHKEFRSTVCKLTTANRPRVTGTVCEISPLLEYITHFGVHAETSQKERNPSLHRTLTGVKPSARMTDPTRRLATRRKGFGSGIVLDLAIRTSLLKFFAASSP